MFTMSADLVISLVLDVSVFSYKTRFSRLDKMLSCTLYRRLCRRVSSWCMSSFCASEWNILKPKLNVRRTACDFHVRADGINRCRRRTHLKGKTSKCKCIWNDRNGFRNDGRTIWQMVRNIIIFIGPYVRSFTQQNHVIVFGHRSDLFHSAQIRSLTLCDSGLWPTELCWQSVLLDGVYLICSSFESSRWLTFLSWHSVSSSLCKPVTDLRYSNCGGPKRAGIAFPLNYLAFWTDWFLGGARGVILRSMGMNSSERDLLRSTA